MCAALSAFFAFTYLTRGTKRTGKPCQGAAMRKGRCKLHGGKSTGPRTPEGLERRTRANWKHGHFSREAKAERSRVRAQYLWSAICAIRSKDPFGPAVGYGPHRTIYLAGQTGIDANGKVAEGFHAQAVQGPELTR